MSTSTSKPPEVPEEKVIEWEETKEEEAGGSSKDKCKKLKHNEQYHTRMMQWADLRRLLSSNDLNGIKEKYHPNALTDDDIVVVKKFVGQNVEKLGEAANAIVKIIVEKTKGSEKTYSKGTGYLVQCPETLHKENAFKNFAVMTNFHVIKQAGIDETVKAEEIAVLFFYDSKEDFEKRGVTCRVAEITNILSGNVGGNNDPSSEHLDFIMLTIEYPENEAKKKSLEKLEPLWIEETDWVQAGGENIRLCIIGHPHGEYKHIAFGGLTTDPKKLWRQWKTDEDLRGVEHTVATCGGSSGSPVIRFDIKDGSLLNKINLPWFPFVHFRGNSKCGDAVSGQSIMPKIREIIQEPGKKQEKTS